VTSSNTPTTGIQTAPFIQLQRNFPIDDVQALGIELDQSYIDIASKINARAIGLYALNYPVLAGEKWYLSSTPQQALRQIYTFTAAGNIPHGIQFSSVSQISPNSYGSYTDGTNYYGVIYASSVAIAGQISFYVTTTNIVVLAGAGAPAITSGLINLEWISTA
jgi:hypothetical protein